MSNNYSMRSRNNHFHIDSDVLKEEHALRKGGKVEPILSSKHNPVKRSDLTAVQKEAADIIDEWFSKASKGKGKQVLRIGGGAGVGKAQSIYTRIPTPVGVKMLGDIKPGDYVFNLHGKPVKVLEVFPQGVQLAYAVYFADGRMTQCNLDHMWTVCDPNNRTRLTNVLLRDILNDREFTYEEGGTTRYKYAVPLGKPIQADGYVSHLNIVRMVKPERIVDSIQHGNYTADYLERVCEDYLFMPVEYRFKFLSHCIDTSVRTKRLSNGALCYHTSSQFMSKMFQRVAWSLGFYARRECKRTGPHYDYYITLKYPKNRSFSPFAELDQFMQDINGTWDESRFTESHRTLSIVSIQPLGNSEQVCILIDDPLHVYLTEDFIPTHNTYLLRYIIDHYNFDTGSCAVMSYTGQSVNVLRSNGIMARTIHSTIMIPVEEEAIDPKTGEPLTRRGIPVKRIVYRPVHELSKSLELLIVDEASFLPDKMERRLKKYGIPILEIGDPIQLPPVASAQCFTMDSLDYFMEGVMRQNQDSELYEFLTRLRKHKNINFSKYHDDVLFLRGQRTLEDTFFRFLPFFRGADMIICCTNRQRQVITDLYREYILKTDSPYPIRGERVICRKNNANLILDQYFLTNGTQGVCMGTVGRSDYDKDTRTFIMNFKPDVVANTSLYYPNLCCDADYIRAPFGTFNSDDFLAPVHMGEKFEFAHAITAHLSQGAQYRTVLFLDQHIRRGDIDYQYRLRYTACTRATDRLIYILPYNDPPYSDLENIEEIESW